MERIREERLQITVPRSYDLGYLQYWPDTDAPAPLVIFLHGAGERGDDLDLLTVHGPPKQAMAGEQLPFGLVAPQCPEDSWWTWQAEAVLALLDETLATRNVDPDRVYLTGLSMGGMGTWDIAARYPQRFAAILPICGSSGRWFARRLATMPIWAFHNADDPAVPVEGTTEMVAAVEQAGGTPRMTVNPTGGHDAWTAAYDDPEVYAWLLRQRRGRPAQA
jgi:predicted peptidase